MGQIGLASPVQWIEAEHYESQHGSTASRFTMSTASGGACVDNDWGRQENHFLRYKLNFAPNFLPLHVTVRYARVPGDAVVSVTLDGDANRTRIVRLPSTGDWGSKRKDGSMPASRCHLRARERTRSNGVRLPTGTVSTSTAST